MSAPEVEARPAASDPEAEAAERDRVGEARETLRRLWDALPAFLVSGTVVCLATGAILWFARGVTPLSLMLLALLAGPLYAGLVRQAAMARAGDTPGAFSLIAAVRAALRPALTLLLPPAVTGSLTLLALVVAGRTGSWAALVPLGVGAATTVLLAIAALVGLPLAAEGRGGRGARSILAALHEAARRPVPVLGVIALLVIAGWAAVELSGTLLFLLPAPLAVVSAVAVRGPTAPTER
ncbi:hypothetical protein [Pseudolysinimonas sp.]|uniref:hypothetical protein n=1 Tax=Pseudolysinimonas sp. TaxID=2680009 RepID=UPI003F7E6DB9